MKYLIKVEVHEQEVFAGKGTTKTGCLTIYNLSDLRILEEGIFVKDICKISREANNFSRIIIDVVCRIEDCNEGDE